MQFHGLRSQARRTAGLLAALAFVAGDTARADVTPADMRPASGGNALAFAETLPLLM